jgi:dCMP deaminase
MRLSLEGYALTLAATASIRSEDPERKVGACVLGAQGEVLALGYNGPPSRVDLDPREWADRDAVRLLTVHAEANALRFVRPREGVLLASTYQPCAECLKLAAAQGIFQVVYLERASERWAEGARYVAERFGMDVQHTSGR